MNVFGYICYSVAEFIFNHPLWIHPIHELSRLRIWYLFAFLRLHLTDAFHENEWAQIRHEDGSTLGSLANWMKELIMKSKADNTV